MKPACILFLCVNEKRNDCVIKMITDRNEHCKFFRMTLFTLLPPPHPSHHVFVYVVGLFHCFVNLPLALLWCVSRFRQCDDDDNYDDYGSAPALTGARVRLPPSPLSPSETVSAVAWRGRLAQEEDGREGGWGGVE